MRGSLGLLFAGMIILSGCLAGGSGPLTTDPVTEPDVRVQVFGPGAAGRNSTELLQLATGNASYYVTDTKGAEPSLGTTKTGSIFMNSFDTMIRSQDKGKTWDVVQ